MRARRAEVGELFSTFRQGHDPRRGAAVLLLVEELANLHAVRCEIYRPFLQESGPEGASLLARFDELSEPIQLTLAELDALSSGVGPMDVLAPDPERVSALVGSLAGQVDAYDRFEVGELEVFLADRMTPDELDRQGARASELRDREQVHPHPGRPPADRQFPPLRRARAVYDRIRNKTSHPRRALSGGGEGGP